MKREEFSIRSNQDNLELGVSLRIPEHPKGILQIVHGMSEHRERYHDFMEYCAEQGYITIIHDHRGHGASIKTENDLGYFYENGAENIVEDVHQITQYIKEQFPNLPLNLFGHSMGSLIVRCYMQKYDQDVDRLIVCGSPSKRVGATIGQMLAKFMRIFKGDHHRSKLIQNLAFSSFVRKHASDKSPNAWIATDEAVVAAYDADPRDGFIFTLNGFEVLFTLSKRCYSKKGWVMNNSEVPIFFIAGAEDPCILSEKDFLKAVDFMKERGYQNVTSKLYPGMRHEILNERGKQEVWQDVVRFISGDSEI